MGCRSGQPYIRGRFRRDEIHGKHILFSLHNISYTARCTVRNGRSNPGYKRCHTRRNNTSSACKRLILNTFLICTDFYYAANRFYKINIDAYRKQFRSIHADMTAFTDNIIIFQIIDEAHIMSGTGVKKKSVGWHGNIIENIISEA